MTLAMGLGQTCPSTESLLEPDTEGALRNSNDKHPSMQATPCQRGLSEFSSRRCVCSQGTDHFHSKRGNIWGNAMRQLVCLRSHNAWIPGRIRSSGEVYPTRYLAILCVLRKPESYVAMAAWARGRSLVAGTSR